MSIVALILMILLWVGFTFGSVWYVFACIIAITYVGLQGLGLVIFLLATAVGSTDMFAPLKTWDLMKVPVTSAIYLGLGWYGLSLGFMWVPILLFIGAGFSLVNGLLMAIGAQRIIDANSKD